MQSYAAPRFTRVLLSEVFLSLFFQIHTDKIFKLIVGTVVIRIDHIEKAGRDFMLFNTLGDTQAAAFFMLCRMQRAGVVCTGAMRT